jgi:hypothetical protein
LPLASRYETYRGIDAPLTYNDLMLMEKLGMKRDTAQWEIPDVDIATAYRRALSPLQQHFYLSTTSDAIVEAQQEVRSSEYTWT